MKHRKEKQVNKQELVKFTEDLLPIIEKIIIGLGFRLLKLTFTPENQTNYLRLTIFRPEQNISLDDCEFISREVGQRLDNLDIVPFSYSLEVQSPGQSHEFVLSGTNLVLGL